MLAMFEVILKITTALAVTVVAALWLIFPKFIFCVDHFF